MICVKWGLIESNLILYTLVTVWPDCAIYWTLGNFVKPLATINLPKSPNYCKGVNHFHFSSEIILGNFYRHLAIFFWSHWSHRTIEIKCQVWNDSEEIWEMVTLKKWKNEQSLFRAMILEKIEIFKNHFQCIVMFILYGLIR